MSCVVIDALDVCRQVLTQTTNVTESLNIQLTTDAVDDNGDSGWQSVRLVAESTYIVVSTLFMLILVFTTLNDLKINEQSPFFSRLV